ncbi:MAG TPA: hypothetical protein VF721_16275 [Pyrinomonadaceae bacterium]
MRSKAVLSIIAFLAAFGISVAVTPRQSNLTVAPFVKKGCAQTETARKITALLSRDLENGRVRNEKIESFKSYDISRRAYLVNFVIATDQYADDSASIDDSDLPQDFKTAWREHMRAWKNQSDLLNEYAFVSRKRGGNDSDEEIGFPQKQYSEQDKEISATWYKVLRVARSYDAYVPPEAY